MHLPRHQRLSAGGTIRVTGRRDGSTAVDDDNPTEPVVGRRPDTRSDSTTCASVLI
jgi:hypothetical protein